MLKAHDINGNWVWAKDFLRGSQYFCPECHEPVFVVMGGDSKQDHFRHFAASSCGWGSRESLAHESKKNSIYDALTAALGEENVYRELRLDDGQRPDVAFVYKDGIVAVEVQYSAISDGDLAERILSYSDKSIPSLWLIGNLKTHINAIPADVFGGVRDKFPAWVRRIASMYSNNGIDQASDSTDLININLTPDIREVKDTDGVWRNQISWNVTRSDMRDGRIIKKTDSHGWPQLLWIPTPNNTRDVLSRGERQKQTRRQLPDDMPYAVDCNRSQVEPQSEKDRAKSIEEAERQVEEGVAAYMARLERERAMYWREKQKHRQEGAP